jgi:hypothetical protein
MTGEFDDSIERDETIARINERGIEKAALAAQLLCRETVELAYDTVEVHLQADYEQHTRLKEEGYPQGEVRGYFVLQGTLTAPREEGEFQRTFSTRLEPTLDDNGHQYMKLHVPVGDIRIQNYAMPSKETVDEIYIEVRDKEDTHWYTVQKTGLYEYIPYVRQDEDSSVLSDRGIWQWVNDRIPENIEMITKLLRRAVNWQTVPQRIEPIQEITLDPPEE